MMVLAVYCVHNVAYAVMVVEGRRVADVWADLNPDDYYPFSKVRVVNIKSVHDGSLRISQCDACARTDTQ